MTIAFNYGAASHLGKVRKNNQDAGYAGPNLLVLADGMGGPAGGDIASAVAVDYLQSLDQQVPEPDSALQNLVQAEATAHDELCDHSSANPELSGLGTTCIAILRTGNQLTITHIGDSRAYLLRDNDLYQVTKDHSYVQQLLDEGRITAEEAANHPHRSVLLRVLGDSQANPELDTMVVEPEIGDRWLLCSDGLCGYVAEEDFKRVLIEQELPQKACDELIELALEAGGIDNVTCVIADIVSDDQEGLPESPLIVGSATDSKKLEKLRRHLHQSLQAESLLTSKNNESEIPADELDTPLDGIALSETSDGDSLAIEIGSTSEDTPAEAHNPAAEATETLEEQSSLEAFAPESEPTKKNRFLKPLLLLAILLILLLVGYMIAEYFGYHINFGNLTAAISFFPQPARVDLSIS